MSAERARLEVTAPSRSAADGLVEQLGRCHCLIVQRGRGEWVVRVQPWHDDGRALKDALSAVEAWLAASGAPATTVTVGERTYTLATEAP